MDGRRQKKIKLDVTTSYAHPVAVLGSEYYEEVQLTEVYVAEVDDKRSIGQVMKALNRLLPMPPSLAHLKRVKESKRIIVDVAERCGGGGGDGAGSSTSHHQLDWESKLRHLGEGVGSRLQLAAVPAKPPRTRAQHAIANASWPCNFHPDQEVERLLAGTFFSAPELERVHRFMGAAMRVAAENASKVAAVVVDPAKAAVVAAGYDKRSSNPTLHAVVTALDQVAQAQKELVDEMRRRKGRDGPETGAAWREGLPYLCTGYDVFVTREPCAMCAMALVHSRVRRVFFAHETAHGALGSAFALHTNRMLNHRFLVFKNVRADECRKLEELEQR